MTLRLTINGNGDVESFISSLQELVSSLKYEGIDDVDGFTYTDEIIFCEIH